MTRILVEVLNYALVIYWKSRGKDEALERSLKGISSILRIIVWGVAIMFFLDNLGFKISTVIAGLGIGGVAVALAAQAVLGDLFSYISIIFDRPFEIGNGQTISAPHMVAIMVEALDIKPGQKILEIGSGSGYHAAVVSLLVGNDGQVFSIERIHALAESAKENLDKAGCNNVTVFKGDGSLGLPDHAPYDRIYVTCASPSVPQPLLDQLRDTGKLLIPVGKMYCELMLLEKNGDHIDSKDLGGCAFVPLVGKHGF